MRALALVLLLGAACQKQPSSPPPAAPSASSAAPLPVGPATTAAWTPQQQGCVDRWLTAQGLDAYCSPQGTLYAGGTPLFDESTGKSTSRQDFLAQHRPEALRDCGL